MSNDENLQLVAAIYPTVEDAKFVLEGLEMMHRAVTITLEDAALITKDENGKVKVSETDDVSGKKGVKRGALIAGTIGLIFPPSILVSGVLGGAIGGLIGRFHDTGIKNDQMAAIGDQLTDSNAAVMALVTPDSVVKVQNSMKGFHGELVIQPVSDDMIKQIFEMKSQGGGSGKQES